MNVGIKDLFRIKFDYIRSKSEFPTQSKKALTATGAISAFQGIRV